MRRDKNQTTQIHECAFEAQILHTNATVKFSCTMFVAWKNTSNKTFCKTVNDNVTVQNGIATFNENLCFQTYMLYDKGTQKYLKKQTSLCLLLVSARKPDQQKLVGRVLVDLSEILNNGAFTQIGDHKLSFCSVKEATLTFNVIPISKTKTDKKPVDLDMDQFSIIQRNLNQSATSNTEEVLTSIGVNKSKVEQKNEKDQEIRTSQQKSISPPTNEKVQQIDKPIIQIVQQKQDNAVQESETIQREVQILASKVEEKQEPIIIQTRIKQNQDLKQEEQLNPEIVELKVQYKKLQTQNEKLIQIIERVNVELSEEKTQTEKWRKMYEQLQIHSQRTQTQMKNKMQELLKKAQEATKKYNQAESKLKKGGGSPEKYDAQKLLQKINKLTKQYEQSEKGRLDNEAELLQVRFELSEIKTEKEFMDTEIRAKDDEIDKLYKQIQDLKASKIQQQINNSALYRSFSMMSDKQRENYSEEIEALKRKMNKLANQLQFTQKVKQNLFIFNHTCEQLEVEKDNLLAELNGIKQEKEKLVRERKQIIVTETKQEERLRKKIEYLQEELKALESELKRNEIARQKLQKRISQLQAENKLIKENQTKTSVQVQEQYANEESKHIRIEQHLKILQEKQKEITNLRAQIDRKQKQAQDQIKKITKQDEKKPIQASSSHKSLHIQQPNQQTAELQTKNTQLWNRNRQLQGINKQLQNKIKEIENATQPEPQNKTLTKNKSLESLELKSQEQETIRPMSRSVHDGEPLPYLQNNKAESLESITVENKFEWLENRNKKLQNNYMELINAVTQLQNRNIELENKNIELENKVIEMQSKVAEAQSLKLEFENTNIEKQVFNDLELMSKKKEVESKNRELEVKEKELKIIANERGKLEVQLKKANEEKQNIKVEMESTKKYSEKLSLKLSQSQTNRGIIQKQNASLKSKVQQSKSAILSLQKSSQALKLKLANLTSESSTNSNKIDKILTDNDQLIQGKDKEISELKSMLDSEAARILEFEERIARYAEKEMKMIENINILEEESRKIYDIVVAKQQNEELLTQALEEKELQVQTVKNQLQKMNNLYNFANQEFSSCKKQLFELRRSAINIGGPAQNILQEIEHLKNGEGDAKMKQLVLVNSQLQKQMRSKQIEKDIEIDSLKMKITMLEKQSENWKTRIKNLQEQRNELKRQRIELNSKTESKSKQDQSVASINILQVSNTRQKQGYEEKIQELKRQNEMMEIQLTSQEQKISQLQEQLQEANKNIKELKSQLEDSEVQKMSAELGKQFKSVKDKEKSQSDQIRKSGSIISNAISAQIIQACKTLQKILKERNSKDKNQSLIEIMMNKNAILQVELNKITQQRGTIQQSARILSMEFQRLKSNIFKGKRTTEDKSQLLSVLKPCELKVKDLVDISAKIFESHEIEIENY